MNRSWPIQLTDHVTVFGNEDFRHYLVGEYQDMLIECGVTASAARFAEQLSDAGRDAPDKLLVMHAHFDHVCGIPELKRRFPNAEVLASSAAARVLDNPKVIAGFFDQDRKVAGYPETGASGANAGCSERIAVDRIVNGGDRIALKGGEHLELIAAPGHSPCGLAAWFEKDRVLFVSDALGFQISDDMIFPVFFHAYQAYIETIERLGKYPAEVLAFPHERIWRGKDVKAVFERALFAARNVREEIVSAADEGRDLSGLKAVLFDRFYRGKLQIYTPENIRLCVDLLVRRSLQDR
ncbi:MBL fold metallo-hydrolase [Desulfococcus sp.]|uniref:MBL fold metallo-hydrolase n=1 Tax=Desulfococcus sp. TaxID=2025834 RepID=UPI003D0C5EF1